MKHQEPARKFVVCPTCGQSVEWCTEQHWRPFCSERCKLIDLGSWFDGSHHIPGDEPVSEPETRDFQEPSE